MVVSLFLLMLMKCDRWIKSVVASLTQISPSVEYSPPFWRSKVLYIRFELFSAFGSGAGDPSQNRLCSRRATTLHHARR